MKFGKETLRGGWSKAKRRVNKNLRRIHRGYKKRLRNKGY